MTAAASDGTLSELGLNPAITHAALVDDAGVVLAATRFAWRGQDAAAVLPGYSAEEAAQMRQARRETLRLDTKQHTLSAMAPVALALRPGRSAPAARAYSPSTTTCGPSTPGLGAGAPAGPGVRHRGGAGGARADRDGAMGHPAAVAALRAGMARIGAGDFSACRNGAGGANSGTGHRPGAHGPGAAGQHAGAGRKRSTLPPALGCGLRAIIPAREQAGS